MAIVQIAGDGGSTPILIEVADLEGADLDNFWNEVESRGVLDKTVTKLTRQLYYEAIGLACTCAAQTKQRLDVMAAEERPDEFEVQFALNVDAKLGAKIVEAGSGSQVQVRMQWNRKNDA